MDYRSNEANAIKMMALLMKTNVIVDSAILDIYDDFREMVIVEGGDDELTEYNGHFALNMATLLTEQNVEDWDNADDGEDVSLRLYHEKKKEVFEMLKPRLKILKKDIEILKAWAVGQEIEECLRAVSLHQAITELLKFTDNPQGYTQNAIDSVFTEFDLTELEDFDNRTMKEVTAMPEYNVS